MLFIFHTEVVLLPFNFGAFDFMDIILFLPADDVSTYICQKGKAVMQLRLGKGGRESTPSCLTFGFSSSSELASEFSYGALFQPAIKSPGQLGISSRTGK